MHGRGTLTHYEGSSYEGIWENGNKVDQQGVYNYPNGSVAIRANYSLKDHYSAPNRDHLMMQVKPIEVDQAYKNRTESIRM